MHKEDESEDFVGEYFEVAGETVILMRVGLRCLAGRT